MTEEDKKLIHIFDGKLRHLMSLFDEQEQEIKTLKKQLSEKETEIEDLEARYTNLKMARTISLYDKDIKDTKQRLSNLVREVDKCIALLNG